MRYFEKRSLTSVKAFDLWMHEIRHKCVADVMIRFAFSLSICGEISFACSLTTVHDTTLVVVRYAKGRFGGDA